MIRLPTCLALTTALSPLLCLPAAPAQNVVLYKYSIYPTLAGLPVAGSVTGFDVGG